MEFQFRMAPLAEECAARLTAPVQSAWRGRPGNEARRMLGKIGFWIAQPGLDAACQRQLVALRLASRDLADVATARKRLELQIAELERQASQPEDPGRKVADEGQGDAIGQLAGLRGEDTELQAEEDRARAVLQRLMAEINAFRDGTQAITAAYGAAEEAARTVRRR